MSASDEFAVAIFEVAGAVLAVDAACLVAVDEDDKDAHDPLVQLDVVRPVGEVVRCGRFAYDGKETRLRLGARVNVVTVTRDQVFALPALLEDLDRRGLLGILRRGDSLLALLDARALCRIADGSA